jgi:hypothetical protein
MARTTAIIYTSYLDITICNLYGCPSVCSLTDNNREKHFLLYRSADLQRYTHNFCTQRERTATLIPVHYSVSTMAPVKWPAPRAGLDTSVLSLNPPPPPSLLLLTLRSKAQPLEALSSAHIGTQSTQRRGGPAAASFL